MAARKKDLKASLEEEIKTMLANTAEPSEGRMKLIALGIKMCALNAKLEESEYGDFFNDTDATGGSAQRKDGAKPASGERTDRKLDS